MTEPGLKEPTTKEADYQETYATIEQTTENDIFKEFGCLEEPETEPAEEATESDPKPINAQTIVETDSVSAPSASSQQDTVTVAGDSVPKSVSEDAAVSNAASCDGGADDQEIAPMEAFKTEAGLVDPETGELIEPSFIMEKFGWTVLPVLGDEPSSSELLDFEEKVDQVLDKILCYEERAARYRAAAEARCQPFDKAAEFYDKQFLKPMSRLLAVYRLKRFKRGEKKGQYSEKTLKLASGLIRFTKTGGAFVHDANELKAYIKAKGVENFKGIEAKEVIQYQHQKLISQMNSGLLKALPGTGYEQPNELGSVKAMSPSAKVSKEAESGDQ